MNDASAVPYDHRLVANGDTPGLSSSRQAERSERSGRALLVAAAELVAEGGLQSLTFVAIGERAGYSRGMVSARFGSKEGLLDALVDRLIAISTHRSARWATGDTGLEAVLGVLIGLRDSTARNSTELRALHALMFETRGDPDFNAKFAAYCLSLRDRLASLVRRGVDDGSISPAVNPDSEAAIIVAAMGSAAYQPAIEPGQRAAVETLAYFHDVTAARLAADGVVYETADGTVREGGPAVTARW